MDTTHITQLLGGLGYEVTFRNDRWTDCLATGHEEAWTGTGRDEAAAAANLLDKMFPSRGAEMLLEKAFEEMERHPLPVERLDAMVRGLHALSIPEPEIQFLADSAQQPAEPPTESEAPPPAPPPPEAREVVLDEAPREVAKVSPVIRFAPDPRYQRRFRPEDVPEVVGAPEPTPEETEPEPQMTAEEACEYLDELQAEIRAETETIGRMAPTTMRMQIAAWIFQARSVQEKFRSPAQGGPRNVEEKVHKIALTLAHLCKIYWPGNVMALNVYCTPTQALEGLVPTPGHPETWAEAAAILEAHTDDLESDAGRDDGGWADFAQLRPPPPKPRAILSEALALIAKTTGAVEGHLDALRGRVRADDVVASLEELVLAAHLLRWVRKACPDGEAWGRAVGVLRWCAREARGRARGLDEVLSESYVPPRGWAELLGRDPEVNRRKKMQREVLERLPEPTWLEEELLEWLRKAFVAFNNPQIAKLACAVRHEILSLSKADFADADRSTRSRLHRLQGILRANEPAPKVELPSIEDLKVVDEDHEDEESTDPADRLLERVCTMTRNKHILFVTNRDDVRLREELERDLECDVTLKNGGSPRGMKAILDSVDGARYDIVCMATGFNNHSADASLCRKTKSEGIPYVRVQKGRRAATIRALGRAFNLLEEGNPGNAPASARLG